MSENPTPIALGPVAFGRWIWRQLTSMRTALILLLLLAIASIPGSLIPQNGVDPNKSSLWRADHPHLTPIYERLHLFDVYAAPWFAAIYILLMISLVGCIIPRLFVYARALRAQPPRTPRNLGRFPDSAAYVSDDAPEVVLERAAGHLRGYRLRRDDASSISAEKGYLREAGNLLFHVSVIIVLVGFAVGQMFSYKGAVQVRVGEQYGFSNNIIFYNDISADGLPPHGSLWKPSMMDPFLLKVKSFTMDWSKGALGGDFDAKGTWTLNSQTKAYDLRVNHPMTIGSTDVFLVGHGYAPVLTLHPAHGKPINFGPTIFPTGDATFHSQGVFLARSEKTPLAISCDFFPVLGADGISSISGDLTYHGTYKRGAGSALSCYVWTGNLGETTAFTVDPRFATKVTGKGGRAFNMVLAKTATTASGAKLHNTVTLPKGLGTLSFDGIGEYVQLQVSHQPFRQVVLGGVMLALLGLLGSLFIRPRRVWVRVTTTAGGTLVEVAALDRTGGGDTEAYVKALMNKLAMKELQDV